MLVGREEDLDALSALLGAVGEGRGGALVLHGDVGAGKSALLAAAGTIAAERGIAVLRGLPPDFVGVPALDTSARFRLAVDLIERIAARPTLLVVDDVHCLDDPTWEMLACLGRRVSHHPVGVLAATRDSPADLRRLACCGLRQRAIPPLTAAAAGRMLETAAPGLAAATRERVVAESEGNPLAVLDLALAAAGTGPSLADAIVADLLDDMPSVTRTVLLVVALGPGRTLSEILPASSIVEGREVCPQALEPAAHAGLLEVDDGGRLRVRHPLLRATLRHRAGSELCDRARRALGGDPAPAPPTEPSEVARLAEDHAGSGAGDLAKLQATIDRIGGMADRAAAAGLLNALAVRFYWTPPDARTKAALVAVADSLGLPAGDPRVLHAIATADPIGRGAAVLERLEQLSRNLDSSLYELHLLGIVANAIAAFDLAAVLHAACLPGLRAQGHAAVLARALTAQAWTAAQLGDTRLGHAAADAATPLAMQTHQPMALLIADLSRAHVEALRGNHTAAEELAASAERAIATAHVDGMLAKVCLVRGVLALGERHFEDAYRHLRRIFDEKDRAYHPYLRFCALAPLAEAGHLGGRGAEIAALADELEPVAESAGSPMLRRGLAYSRAVTATDDEAPALFQAALDANLSSWPLERARLELAYGVWLGRHRRTAEARGTLRSALATFDALGVDAWSARAQRRLRSVRGPDGAEVGGLDELTQQQRRVARLAADGLTNREIAERLFLSPRTVTTHLSRIYARVSAGSRVELARLLPKQATRDT